MAEKQFSKLFTFFFSLYSAICTDEPVQYFVTGIDAAR